MRRFAYAVLAAALAVSCQSPTKTTGGGTPTGAAWQAVGTPPSEGSVKYVSMALDISGNPYLAFSDYGTTAAERISVVRYQDGAWAQVGDASFSDGEADDVSIAVASNGTPYVAYTDWTLTSPMVCKMYNGAGWATADAPATTGTSTQTLGMAADKSGNVYWAVDDTGTGGRGASLFKTGAGDSAWTFVAAYGSPSGDTGSFQLKLDGNGVPYFAVEDDTNRTLSVAKLNGSSFTALSTTGLPTDEEHWPTLAFDSSNSPYLSYQDWDSSTKQINVLKYTGTAWTQAGNADFSAHEAWAPTIACLNNTPYVVYADQPASGTNDILTIQKLSGSTWTTVASTGFNQKEDSDWHTIAFDATGVPFVSFLNDSNNYKPGVIKYQ